MRNKNKLSLMERIELDEKIADHFIYIGYGALVLFYISLCVGGFWFLWLLTKFVISFTG